MNAARLKRISVLDSELHTMKRFLTRFFLLFLAVAGGLWLLREPLSGPLNSHAPALAGWLGLAPHSAAKAAAAPARNVPAIPVVVAEATRRDVPNAFDAVGTVQAIASMSIRPRIDSQIVEVHVSEGANVKDGDLLFSLDARTLKAQIAQVEAQISRDRAQLEQARRDLVRFEGLVAQKITTEVTRDNQMTAVKVAEATLSADLANRDNLVTQLSFTEIRSPVNGRLGSLPAKAGSIVRQADTASLATINQLDPIFVVFALPQARLGELQSAMHSGSSTVEVKTSRGIVRGEIAFIENTVDTTTGTINVKARMNNSSEALWPGSFVPVRIVLSMQADAISVPAAAVQLGQKSPYVFVVDQDNKARVRPVNVARTVDGVSVIAAGVAAGDRVVVDGTLRLVDGAAVLLKDARTADDARPPGSKKPAS